MGIDCAHTHARTRTHARAHARTHARMRTRTHAHAHARMPVLPVPPFPTFLLPFIQRSQPRASAFARRRFGVPTHRARASHRRSTACSSACRPRCRRPPASSLATSTFDSIYPA
eukprot:2920156-Pleurochrysis_carterae.AAC.1